MSEEITKMFVVVGANIDEFKRGMSEVNTVASGTAESLSAGLDTSATRGELDKLKDSTAEAGKEAEKAQNSYRGFGKAIALAAITTGVMVFKKVMTDAAEYGVEITKAGKSTGLTTGLLQELKFGAETTGSSFSTLTNAVEFLNRKMKDAVEGKDAAVLFFEDIGLSVDDLMKMKPDERILKIFEAISKIEDPAVKSALAIKGMGQAATDLIPLIDNLDKVQAAAAKLNIKMTDDQIKSLNKGAEATGTLWVQWQILSNKFAATMWPSVTELVKGLQVLVDWLGKALDAWNSLNPWLRKAILSPWGAGGLVTIPQTKAETVTPSATGGASKIELYIDGEQVTNVVERRLYRDSYGSRGYV